MFNGLDSNKKYSVKEINVYPGADSTLKIDVVLSGDFLMKAGYNPDVNLKRTSVILEVTEVK